MASGARHDTLLDLRRSAPSDLPQRWEGGRAGASCDPSAAAVRLKAVIELYAVFKEIASEALGGRKCHSHFEQWLWACRVDLIVSGAICAPVLTAVPPAAMEDGARRAPNKVEVRRYPAGHFDIYVKPCFDQVVADQTEFYCQHLRAS